MSDQKKRIIELPTASAIPDTAYFAIDSVVDPDDSNTGARKVLTSNFKSYKEVTQAEYDALPDSKLTDGILYAISDGEVNIVNDVEVNGTSVVTDGVAEVTVPEDASDLSYDNTDSGLTATNVQDAIDEVVENGGNVDDVKVDGVSVVDENKVAQINLSAQTMVGSVSGLPQPIATFSDGANLPLKELVVGIEPVQDLHGYDYPWPPGGGKNKFNPSSYSGISYYTINSDESITVIGSDGGSWDSRPVISLKAGTYTVSYVATAGNLRVKTSIDSYSAEQTVTVSTPYTFTLSEDGGCKFKIGLSAGTYPITVKIQLESGSSATSWTPYSNECPISGWSQVKVTRCGKNLFNTNSDGIKTNRAIRMANATEQEPLGSMITISGYNALEYYVPVLSSTKYTISLPYSYTATAVGLAFYSDKGIDYFISGISLSSLKSLYTFTTPNNAKYIRFCWKNNNGNGVVLNQGETITTDSYTGNDFIIQLGDTYYGATLDVVGGVLTIDRVTRTFTENDTIVVGGSGNCVYINDSFPNVPTTEIATDYMSDRLAYQVGATYTNLGTGKFRLINVSSTNTRFIFKPFDETCTEQNVTTWLTSNHIQVVSKLATPISVTLTETEIEALEGVNNIYADSGQINELSYIRDASTTINQILARLDALES